MKDIDAKMATFSPDRDHSFKIRGETFRGRLGLDYELVASYMSRVQAVDERYSEVWRSLLEAFLGTEEYGRFDAWRLRQRDEGNPLTIYEVTLIGAAVIDEETDRPTRASSDSLPGRETSGDGSTDASTSPGTEEDRQHSLSAVS